MEFHKFSVSRVSIFDNPFDCSQIQTFVMAIISVGFKSFKHLNLYHRFIIYESIITVNEA